MDGFLTELSPTGAPLASSYVGGSGYDVATAVALTPSGGPVVVGATQSADFPASGHLTGGSDAFASTPSGARFLGGEAADAVAVDAKGRVFVAGRALNPSLDVFVTQLDGDTTPLGGGGSEQPAGIAVDPLGNAYVTGRAEAGFPAVNALQPNDAGGIDAFVAKLATGTSPTPAPQPVVPVLPPAPAPAPPPKIVARPPLSTTDRTVRFAFTGGGACRIDGAAFAPCGSPYTSPKLAPGPHRFEVKAGDSAPAAFSFRVVTSKPQVRRTTCHGTCVIRCPRTALCLVDPGRKRAAALGIFDASRETVRRYRCRCSITTTVDRQLSELGAALSDGPSLLVYVPAPGALTVSGNAAKTATVKAAAAGAVRVPLKLTHKTAKSVSVTATFQPADGAAVARGMTLRLPRHRD
jgi:hypothetical protein